MSELKSFFIRHAEKMDVDANDIRQIYEENKIAIHYPGGGPADSPSINPRDYNSMAYKKAIKTFAELNRDGGYIWAQFSAPFYTPTRVKIGKIAPQSFQLFTSRWANQFEQNSDGVNIRRNAGDPAILKTLQMIPETVREVLPGQALDMRVARPPMTTLCHWNIIKGKLGCHVERRPIDPDWGNLSEPQQVTFCAEFLRETPPAEFPALAHLLVQVGGTMEDLDIYGCDRTGRPILGQVTYAKWKSPTCRKKLGDLQEYDTGNESLILFYNDEHHEGIQKINNIVCFPVSRVLDWLMSNPLLSGAIFYSL